MYAYVRTYVYQMCLGIVHVPVHTHTQEEEGVPKIRDFGEVREGCHTIVICFLYVHVTYVKVKNAGFCKHGGSRPFSTTRANISNLFIIRLNS